MDAIVAVMLRVLQKATQRPILGFTQSSVPNLVSRLLEAVCRVLVNDPRFNRVCEDAAEEAHGADGGTAAAAYDRLAAQFLRLHHDARLTGNDILHQVVHVRLGDVLDPARAEQRNDVPPYAPDIGRNRGRLLGPSAFSEDETCLHVCDVLLAKLPNGDGASFLFPFGCRIFSLSDLAQQGLRFR